MCWFCFGLQLSNKSVLIINSFCRCIVKELIHNTICGRYYMDTYICMVYTSFCSGWLWCIESLNWIHWMKYANLTFWESTREESMKFYIHRFYSRMLECGVCNIFIFFVKNTHFFERKDIVWYALADTCIHSFCGKWRHNVLGG